MGILKWIKGKRVLYYPGCLTKGVLTDELKNYKEIFARLKIEFVMLPEEGNCCGLPILNTGDKKNAKKLAIKNMQLFKEMKIDKIVTNCPSCFYMFNEIYPKLIRDWDIQVEHVTITILKELKKKRIKWVGNEMDREVVSYHDSCYLGRYSGIYEEPRDVINLLGGKIVESKFNREKALCCGGGGGVRENFRSLAENIAKERINEFSNNVKKIISPCGLCHINLKSKSDKSMEFSTFVLGKLRGIKNVKS